MRVAHGRPFFVGDTMKTKPTSAPSDITVRMGPKPCMTSKGPSKPGATISHGIVISLPAHEAENLLSLGYATRV